MAGWRLRVGLRGAWQWQEEGRGSDKSAVRWGRSPVQEEGEEGASWPRERRARARGLWEAGRPGLDRHASHAASGNLGPKCKFRTPGPMRAESRHVRDPGTESRA